MKKKKLFLWIYIAFAAVLLALFTAAVLYVRGLLVDYEAARPERQAELAIEQLAEEADARGFWEKYALPQVDASVRKGYLALLKSEGLTYVTKAGNFAEDEMGYLIRSGSFPVAEVYLKAKGPAETKLAVFTLREWEISGIKPLLEEREYTASLPEGFGLKADGIVLEGKAEGGKAKFSLKGVYLEPEFTVTAADGTEIGYEVKNFRVVPAIFEYDLTLPATLKVEVDGEVMEGAAISGGRLRYTLMRLEKPEMTITDLYGNSINYDGETPLPLTYLNICAPADYSVSLSEGEIAEEAISQKIRPEYALLEGLVKDLPQQAEYNIAILKEDAVVTVLDGKGNAVPLEEGRNEFDFAEPLKAEDKIPAAIAEQVDVLKVAQNWSLFMSNDVSFSKMAEQMAPDSYQYEVAKKYSTSIDRQFFASHSLLSPAFTENEVRNFTYITEDAFSVEVSFTKHMRLNNGGKLVDDAMNDRFYFVRSGNRWLLAGLKEVEADGR